MINPYPIVIKITSSGKPTGYSGIGVGAVTITVIVNVLLVAWGERALGLIPPDASNWIGEVEREMGLIIGGCVKDI